MVVNYAPPPTRVNYPDADALPLAESDFQRKPLMYALEALEVYFADRADVYVAGNMFIYFEQGNPESVVAPDVFVVIGASKKQRHSYRTWEEGKKPDFVLEITSAATYAKDQGAKRGTYALLGVREYFQYDPTGDYLEPPLQGLRLTGRNYDNLPIETLRDGVLSIHSQVLGLDVRLDTARDELRLYDPATRSQLPTYAEARNLVDRETAARREAEAEIARLRAELERLKGHPPG